MGVPSFGSAARSRGRDTVRPDEAVVVAPRLLRPSVRAGLRGRRSRPASCSPSSALARRRPPRWRCCGSTATSGCSSGGGTPRPVTSPPRWPGRFTLFIEMERHRLGPRRVVGYGKVGERTVSQGMTAIDDLPGGRRDVDLVLGPDRLADSDGDGIPDPVDACPAHPAADGRCPPAPDARRRRGRRRPHLRRRRRPRRCGQRRPVDPPVDGSPAVPAVPPPPPPSPLPPPSGRPDAASGATPDAAPPDLPPPGPPAFTMVYLHQERGPRRDRAAGAP